MAFNLKKKKLKRRKDEPREHKCSKGLSSSQTTKRAKLNCKRQILKITFQRRQFLKLSVIGDAESGGILPFFFLHRGLREWHFYFTG